MIAPQINVLFVACSRDKDFEPVCVALGRLKRVTDRLPFIAVDVLGCRLRRWRGEKDTHERNGCHCSVDLH
jgi:hypothetical protein